MKKIFSIALSILCLITIVGCSQKNSKKDIELMGAGDRIHDTYTFANNGVKIEEKEENVYRIFGSVDKMEDVAVKDEFEIDADVSHVVAVKLSANGRNVVKEKVSIKIDGIRSFDAEHLNGSDYTFIILEAVKNKSVAITVSWDGENEINYVLMFDENLTLK